MKRDPVDNARALYKLAEPQAGYFTAAQARRAGYGYRQHHYHTRRGTWQRVGHGVFRLRDFSTTDREDLARLMLWSCNRVGEPQATVSHDTALGVYELSDLMPSVIHLTVPRVFRKPAPPGVRLHVADLLPTEISQRDSFLITSPLRTLLDVAGSPLSQEHLNAAARAALQRGLVRISDFEALPGRSDADIRLRQAFDRAVGS